MLYKYKGFHNCDSICDIKVYDNIVVATEIEDNNGTSITNMAEVIATDIAKKYHIKMKNLVWFECYNNPILNSRVRFKIENKRFTNPTWESVEKEYIQDLIKGKEEIAESNIKEKSIFKDILIIVKIITFILLIIIAVPLFIDYCIIGNSIQSNIDNSDWVSFLGSYISSIVSSIATVLGILWTIKYTKEQSKADREFAIMQTNEDRRLQHMPYLKYDYTKYSDSKTTLFIIFDGEHNKDINKNMTIKNVGLGPVIDLVVNISKNNTGHIYKSNIIEPGEEIQLSLKFRIKNQNIELITELDGSTYPSNDMFSYRRRTINISYKDLLGNIYEQSITAQITTNFECKNGVWEYSEPSLIFGQSTKALLKR